MILVPSNGVIPICRKENQFVGLGGGDRSIVYSQTDPRSYNLLEVDITKIEFVPTTVFDAKEPRFESPNRILLDAAVLFAIWEHLPLFVELLKDKLQHVRFIYFSGTLFESAGELRVLYLARANSDDSWVRSSSSLSDPWGKESVNAVLVN